MATYMLQVLVNDDTSGPAEGIIADRVRAGLEGKGFVPTMVNVREIATVEEAGRIQEWFSKVRPPGSIQS